MYKCKKCEFKTENKSEIGNHYKYHHNEKIILNCKFCQKEFKSQGRLLTHEKNCKGEKIKEVKICPKCNFEIKANFDKHLNYCDGRGPRRKRPKLGLGWSKGLNKFSDERIAKISKSLENRVYKGTKHTEETKKLLSEIMKKRYESGWESTAGRCKKLEYDSPVAGKVKVDGNWEFRVAEYLDKIGVTWVRNKKRFRYFNSIDDKISTYCPDFYVSDWDCYIEVKGFKTELDEIKWKQFKGNLEIWDKDKLNTLGIDTRYRKRKNVQIV
jgi:hypothetical protein